jgi:hypothetical protein
MDSNKFGFLFMKLSKILSRYENQISLQCFVLPRRPGKELPLPNWWKPCDIYLQAKILLLLLVGWNTRWSTISIIFCPSVPLPHISVSFVARISSVIVLILSHTSVSSFNLCLSHYNNSWKYLLNVIFTLIQSRHKLITKEVPHSSWIWPPTTLVTKIIRTYRQNGACPSPLFITTILANPFHSGEHDHLGTSSV